MAGRGLPSVHFGSSAGWALDGRQRASERPFRELSWLGIGWQAEGSRASISGAQLVGHWMAGRGLPSVHCGSSAGWALDGRLRAFERPFRELSWLGIGWQAEGFRASIWGAQLVGHWIAGRGLSSVHFGSSAGWASDGRQRASEHPFREHIRIVSGYLNLFWEAPRSHE